MRHGGILALVILTSGCVTTAGLETERTICRELRNSLPSYSAQDTEQTKQEGADFLDVFGAVCG